MSSPSFDPIGDDDLVLRRIPPEWVVETDEGLRPSSQAFNNDGDGEPMSCYLDSALAAGALGHADVLDGNPGFFLTALPVGVLIHDEDQTVRLAPIHPAVHVCDPAHTEVVGVKANKRRKRIARIARWVPNLSPDGAAGPYL